MERHAVRVSVRRNASSQEAAGSALNGAKATPFASFELGALFASGKPQNFNAVFTTELSRRLAGRRSVCILTNAG
jgi:hypothetical protein